MAKHCWLLWALKDLLSMVSESQKISNIRIAGGRN
jgi:hypothetical protein